MSTPPKRKASNYPSRRIIFKLLVLLIRQNALSTIEVGGSSVQSGTLEAFRELLVYMNENCNQSLTASDAAKRSMMSYSRLASLFKQTMQTSFSHYLMFLRIRKAEQLLLDSSKSMTQIALECGFNSPSYFIKQFKRSKGLSPMQYRKSMTVRHSRTSIRSPYEKSELPK